MKQKDYELELERQTSDRNEIFKFYSADGIASKNSFRDAELALADIVEPGKDEDLLGVQAGFGFLPVVLGDRRGQTVGASTSDRAFQLISENINANSVENTEAEKVAFYSELGRFDKIVYAPHSYEPVDVVKNRISELIGLLDDGKELFIAGQKTSGINRYTDYLDSVPGELKKIEQRGSQRIYRYQKDKDASPEQLEVETSFKAEVKDVEAEFQTQEGLFSPHNLDDGSRLLIENIELDQGTDVLDLACGYGAIGVFLKKLFDVEISLSDDNALATYYAQKNLEGNNVEDYELENRDCLEGFNQNFDAIVSNPPTHQGSGITDEMFRESYRSLSEDGELFIVYNKNMEYEEKISGIFSSTEVLAEKDNYRVLRAQK